MKSFNFNPEYWLILFVSGFWFFTNALPQTNDQLKSIERSIDAYALYELPEIETTLKNIVATDPANVKAYSLLGRLEMRRQDWGDAKDWFDKIFKYESESKLAHYYLGICDREDGITKVPLRIILWRNARKHFEKVIASDSSFKDVFLQYAWLKRYQKDYAEAIDLCLTQISINTPQNPVKEIFWFYDDFIANGGISSINPLKGGNEYVEEWLKARHSIYDRFALAEHWRRQGKFASADSLFRRVLAEPDHILHIPIYLARVRLYYETGPTTKAEEIYWQAIEHVRNFFDFEFIFDDMHYIFTDREFALKFKTAEDAQYFCRTFWRKKDPLPAAPFNVRLAEHYRRLIYAEKNYRYDGFRLFVNDPDRLRILHYPEVFHHNRILNDRGLIYIRFGPPDETAMSLSQSTVLNESWLYYPRESSPKLIFHFEVHGGPGCWRLTPILSNWSAYEDRLGWDNKMAEYYMAHDLLTRFQVESEMKLESRQIVAWALENEFHTWSDQLEPIPMNIQAKRFYGDSSEYIAEISIAAPVNALFNPEAPPDTIELETGAVVFDVGWRELQRETRQNKIVRNESSFFYQQNYIRKFRFGFDQQKVRCASHLRQIGLEKLNGFKFDLDFSPFKTDSLMCSDIELAYQIEPSNQSMEFTKNGLSIIPNPTAQFKRTDPIYIYYEIYNLNPNTAGHTHYEVEYTATTVSSKANVIQKLWSRISGNQKKSISIRNTHEGTQSTSREYLALDFSQFNPSVVKLKVKVIDIITTASYETETEFELF